MKRLFWVLAVTALAGIATAQDFYHRPSPFAGRTLLTLAVFDEVRTELKTSSEVNAKVDALVEKMSGEAQEAFSGANGDFAGLRPAIEKINNKYDEELVKLLTPEQATRLKQVFVQYNGGGAIPNPAISKDLDITDDQKTKIKKLLDDQQEKMVEAFTSGGGSPEEAGKAIKKLGEETGVALLKLLTDDQKKKFKDMEGEKFTFKKDGAKPVQELGLDVAAR